MILTQRLDELQLFESFVHSFFSRLRDLGRHVNVGDRPKRALVHYVEGMTSVEDVADRRAQGHARRDVIDGAVVDDAVQICARDRSLIEESNLDAFFGPVNK